MKIITLDPDWKSSPLRINDGAFPKDRYGFVICPEELNLSSKLCVDLYAWIDLYDTQMDWDNAPEMFEWTQEQHDEFVHQGEVLLERLRTELGDTYQVRRGDF